MEPVPMTRCAPSCRLATRRGMRKRQCVAPSTRVAGVSLHRSSFVERWQRSAVGKESPFSQRTPSLGRNLSMILPLIFLSAAVLPQDTLRLSLPDAVTIALRGSDEVRRANADIAVTAAQLTTSRASAFPQLRLTGAYTHVFANARARAVNQVFNQPNTYNVNANLSQTLFQGGREFAAWRAARRMRDAARLTGGEARADVTVNVLRAYLDASL